MGSNRRNLKAFVRYDGSGRVIPGGPILSAKKPKVGNWKEINAYQCCNPAPQPTGALRLTFDSIENANLLVGDASNVVDWNAFFDLPTYGNPFTSVQVVGNEVRLFGGSNIKVKPGLMYTVSNRFELLSINDQAGCITSVGGDAFSYSDGLLSVSLPECTIVYGYQDSPSTNDYGGFGSCLNLTTLDLPKLTTAGDYSFGDCISLTTVNFLQLTTAGNSCFSGCLSLTTISLPDLTSIGLQGLLLCTSLETIYFPSCTDLGGTVGDNNVFNAIIGNNITLTIPSALMTCNSGNPDGDIQYLQANNTVTIITV